jgi:hypothetical protein
MCYIICVACVQCFIVTLISKVVELDHHYREKVQQKQLHTYMYGQIIEPPQGITSATLGGETLTDLVLSPSSSVISFDDLKIYRIGAGKGFRHLYSHVTSCFFFAPRDYGAFICFTNRSHTHPLGNATRPRGSLSTRFWTSQRRVGLAHAA